MYTNRFSETRTNHRNTVSDDNGIKTFEAQWVCAETQKEESAIYPTSLDTKHEDDDNGNKDFDSDNDDGDS